MATKVRAIPQWGHEAAIVHELRVWRGHEPRLGQVLWRHKLLIVVCVVIVLGFTVAYVSGRTPVYESTALVATGEGGQGALMPNSNPEDQLRIESYAMAERLVERLNLQFLPEFQPEPASGLRIAAGWPERLWHVWADTLTIGPASGQMTDEERAARLRRHVMAVVRARIRTEVVRPTVLALQFISEDPQLAAAGANALGELYVEEHMALRQNASRAARELIDREIESLRASISGTELAIEAQRATAGQIPQGKTTRGLELLEQKLQAERAQLQNHLERLEQLQPQASEPVPDARIIAPAVVPDQPIHLRPAVLYGAALASALLFGILVAFGLEALRRARA